MSLTAQTRRGTPGTTHPTPATARRPAGAGPRIYNLFPLLAGTVEDWKRHLPRIAAMGFDWVFLNPVHYPGFSGSLYAVKDPYRLNDLFRGDADADTDTLLRDFFTEARRHGLRVMLDLVVNHTAKDALLAEQHPDWYVRNRDGSLRSPRAANPQDPTDVTVWGDLAELDYGRQESREGLIRYWADWVRHQVGLGAAGFRCDAAYQVPAGVWRALIEAARSVDAEVPFFAETLGCTPEQVASLADAGFDYLFNSAKWWDFRSDWFLEQYELYRSIAPTIAFPESHDTERLAAETGTGDARHLAALTKMRYLFSAAVSSGVMLPAGFEYGFTRRLNVVETRPQDWQAEAAEPRLDLSGFIADVNAMKASVPALNREGPLRRITGAHDPVVALLRSDPASGESALLLLNPDTDGPRSLDPAILLAAGDGGSFEDVTPSKAPAVLRPGAPLALEPLELRIFRGRPAKPAVAPDPGATLARLAALAEDRVAVEDIYPCVDGGRFAVKRVVGDVMEVWADIFADGHDRIAAVVQYRVTGEAAWAEAPMVFVDNDRWAGRIPLTRNARYEYRIEAWRDLFTTWRADFVKKRDAGRDVSLELVEGRGILEKAVEAAEGRGKATLAAHLEHLRGVPDQDRPRLAELLLGDSLAADMARFGARINRSHSQTLEVVADRLAARFSSWYELFPRSMSDDPTRHGTFDDVIAKLPYVRDMGFDVLYFPPIHPIGRSNRKGRNNSLTAGPDDPGSPYAIGSEAGGHDAIHPELGTLDDFRRLVRAAKEHGLEIALDFAIQCSPDHPWIKEHPDWFDWRPDGSIRYAENPPKKYEDIVNVHFYRQALPDLWFALRDVVLFWVEQGVKIFRVDNPHTKPLPFWEWMIREVQDRHPDTIFLAEAFTRPKMMKRLAKLGFTQSYTYFTWRRHKQELTDYLVELTQGPAKEYYRPNFFVNTPDINPPYLHSGNPAMFRIRAVLATMLSSVWGMYSGFELCEGTPLPGKEEYLDSEKYEIRAWNWDDPRNIREYIRHLNQLRRDEPALQHLTNLRFYTAHHDGVLYFGKADPRDSSSMILCAVSLDPDQGAYQVPFEVPLWELGLPDDAAVQVEDLFSGGRWFWYGKWQNLTLEPWTNPAALWRITRPS
ncbi:maltotransferase domain-containing protein [Rhodocista pekingensis]|uniref:Alpha-1,4-glucan:maltose-1-phosphate maltosyltransferase n=1 Tax=Rhodocista pekingensis TaxID=201185 RepID=A0ABW2KZ95_9PROT